ncbi:MAG: sigma-E factor negative regulatory protein [Spongiibacteraceae bacterium]|jgi:sigma-E factor negative regulatory protein RseA|nr:sigma-E factor negative regulatory protein [Spongiibacteraceae bacterium]
MSDKLRESVSALMDDEAGELELRQLLAAADQPEVRAAWRDFHIQRDSLAGLDVRFAEVDISRRVWAALADEPSLAPATRPANDEQQAPAVAGRKPARWLRPLTSMAVAASVAALVVIGVRGLDSSSPVTAPGIADIQPAASESLPLGPVDQVAPGGAAAVTVSVENDTGLLPVDEAELALEAEIGSE